MIIYYNIDLTSNIKIKRKEQNKIILKNFYKKLVDFYKIYNKNNELMYNRAWRNW
jgi:hypothetical protein